VKAVIREPWIQLGIMSAISWEIESLQHLDIGGILAANSELSDAMIVVSYILFLRDLY